MSDIDPEIANTLALVLSDVPLACGGIADSAKDGAMAVWMVKLELDLIEEGQDGTQHYTKKDIREIKAFLKRYKDMLPK